MRTCHRVKICFFQLEFTFFIEFKKIITIFLVFPPGQEKEAKEHFLDFYGKALLAFRLLHAIFSLLFLDKTYALFLFFCMHFFAEDFFDELEKFGKIWDLVVTDNMAPHLAGNTYAKFNDGRILNTY